MNRYYSQTIPDNGLIKKYLHSRGIDEPVPPTIKLHPGLEYYDGKDKIGSFPAMVCKIIFNSAMIGLHITYLKKDGSGKADVPIQRKFRSCSSIFSHGYIPLYPFNNYPGSILFVGEGIETCLAVREMTGNAVWCAMSARGLEYMKLPEPIVRIQIIADNDPTKVGIRAASRLQAQLEAEGRLAGIAMPEDTGDWNDVLLKHKQRKK